MRRDWTTIGEHLLIHSEGDRARVARAIDALDWEGHDPATNLDFGPDWLEEATRAIKRIPLSEPLRIVFSDALAPNKLFGVECRELNGLVRYFVIQQAGDLYVVAADFFPNAVGQRQAVRETQ